ncbi:hypothetical protein BsWGS_16434 [Bradybaena similaris]
MNNTTSFDFSGPVPEPALWMKASFVTYLLVIHVMGVPGNIIVAVVYGRTSPKSACDWLIFIMGVTDCVVCFCTPLFYLRAELRIDLPGKFNALFCFQNWLQFSAMIASCLILVVIAVDRYIKVCRRCACSLTPLRARNLGVLCVFISTIICVFPFARQGQTTGCLIYGVKPPESVRTFALIMFCAFIICFVIVIFAYANICKQISDKNTLRRRLKQGNGLRKPTNDVYSANRTGDISWWQKLFLKRRGMTVQILYDPNEIDENDCGKGLNSQLVDDVSSDNVQGCRLRHDENHRDGKYLFLCNSSTTSSRDDALTKMDTEGVTETGPYSIGVQYRHSGNSQRLGNTDKGETSGVLGKFKVLSKKHSAYPFAEQKLQISGKTVSKTGGTEVLKDVKVKTAGHLNHGNDGDCELICNCSPSNHNYEILSDAKRFKNNLTAMSIGTLQTHEEICTTASSLKADSWKPCDIVQTDYNRMSPGLVCGCLRIRDADDQLMSNNEALNLEACDMDNRQVFLTKHSCEIQARGLLPSLNYTDFGYHRNYFKGSNSCNHLCMKNYLLSELTWDCSQCLSRKRKIRSIQLKKSVSCPHLVRATYDRTTSSAMWPRQFRIHASQSEIFDRLAKKTSGLPTKHRRDFAVRCSDSSECNRQGTILNKNKSLSLLFPIDNVGSIQESIESCKIGFNDKAENAIKSGNSYGHNEHIPDACDDFCDVCFNATTSVGNSSRANVASPSSVIYLSNKKCINRDLNGCTCIHDCKSRYNVHRSGCCCHDNISTASLAYSGDIKCSLGNGDWLHLPKDGTNQQTGYDTNKSQTELYSALKTDFLAIPCLPRRNPNGQKCDSVSGDTRKNGESQMLRVNVSIKENDDSVSRDLPSESSSSRYWKQTDESQPLHPTSTMCGLKSLPTGSRCNRERQMTLMLASVTAAFLLSWLPPWVFHILWYYGPIENSQSFVVWYTSKIYLIIYAINPIIYYNFNQSFRSKVRHLLEQIFKRCYCKENKHG